MICGDVHWSQYSSIMRKRGERYSQRLEYLIKSIDWVEATAKAKGCGKVVYLGDFFDKPSVNDEELTALGDISWYGDAQHTLIVGNHESSVNGLRYNSTNALGLRDGGLGFTVVSEPLSEMEGGVELCYMPYVIEDDRKPLEGYFGERKASKRVIFSHNDIKGLSFGAVTSKTGFEVGDMLASCDLFINGHIHNGAWIEKGRIRNLGNVCGQNFGEDAFRYRHQVMILDTDSMTWEDIYNPHALNFVQIDVDSEEDFGRLENLPPNAVVNIRCRESLVTGLKDRMGGFGVLAYRIMSVRDDSAQGKTAGVEFSTDGYLTKFSQFVMSRLGDSDVVREELMEVLR